MVRQEFWLLSFIPVPALHEPAEEPQMPFIKLEQAGFPYEQLAVDPPLLP